jgi:hypothetical protein
MPSMFAPVNRTPSTLIRIESIMLEFIFLEPGRPTTGAISHRLACF